MTTKKLLKNLKQVECPDTTFIAEKFPIVMKKAKGIFVTDVENKKYTDMTSFFGVTALGHSPQTTVGSAKKQLTKLIHGMGDVHPSTEKIALLQKLAACLPFESPKIHLSLSGGDAVETAIKTAILATQRNEFLVFQDGYHGLQFGPLALNHRPEFTQPFQNWIQGKSQSIPFPLFPTKFTFGEFEKEEPELIRRYGFEKPETTLEMVEAHLKTKRFAGLILEPIQGRGGKRNFTTEYLKKLKNLCKKYGTLLIFDEIFTGLGRTGKLFGYERYDVIPDMICVGKALGGGFPLSACAGDILNAWPESQGEAMHTQTFLGHPLTCRVATDTLGAIQRMLPAFQKELCEIETEHQNFIMKYENTGLHQKHPFHLSGAGFMRGIWFYKSPDGFCVKIMEELLKSGYLTLPEGRAANVLAVTPPLITKAPTFKKFYNKLIAILEKSDSIS